MGYASVTNTFTDGTYVDSTQWNQNFTDLVNGMSDGSSDMVINGSQVRLDSTCGGVLTVDELILPPLLAPALLIDATAQAASEVIHVNGDCLITGDISYLGWTDYSDDSIIYGWSSYTVKSIKYKRTGNFVEIVWNISGTSNINSASFSMPLKSDTYYTGDSDTLQWAYFFPTYAVDNSVVVKGSGRAFPDNYGLGQYGVMSLHKNWTWTGTPWTDSGTKTSRGYAYYFTDQ